MAHLILDDNFYAFRNPAWHGVGTVSQIPQSFVSAAHGMAIPHIATHAAGYQNGSGVWCASPDHRAIVVCAPSPEGQYTSIKGTRYNRHISGYVGKDYHLYDHWAAIYAAQECIPAPCETMGVLKHGEVLFLTVKLPIFGFRGDEMQPYLIVCNTCDGRTSIHGRTTLVRVVCWNTLNMALGRTSEQHVSINHLSNPDPHVRKFLTEVWEGAAQRVATLTEACDALASIPVLPADVTAVTEAIYPAAAQPDTADLDILAAWERATKHQREHRDNVITLLESSGTRTAATSGNLWGLYNAVVEYEDFGKARNTPYGRFMGESARRKERAFDVCLSLSTI